MYEVLSAGIYVQHVHTWYIQRPEEAISLLLLRVRDGRQYHCVALRIKLVLCKISEYS